MTKPLEPPEAFLAAAVRLKLQFDDGDIEKLGTYLAMLLEHTTRVNLTAIREPDEAWTRHIYDSLALLPLIDQLGGQVVADVGSGGGLPGVPLAICMPHVRFSLIESTQKKAAFLRTVVEELRLENTCVVSGRAETLGAADGPQRSRYDIVVARAVGRLPILIELTVPLVRLGGYVLAVKGQQADQEVSESREALRTLRAEHIHTEPTETGRVVVLRKTGDTPRAYPRRPGEPKRAPLACDPRIRSYDHDGS